MHPPFQVRTAGLIEGQPYHSTPGTKKNDIMLTVFLGGRGTYRNGSGGQTVRANMVGLVLPEERGVLAADPEDPYVHYYCRFNGDYARDMARRIVQRRGGRFFAVPNADEVADCVRPMGRLNRYRLPTRMGRPEVLLARALVAVDEESAEDSGRRILTEASLREYLGEHMAEPTNLTRIADDFYMSKASLCRATRRLTGRTVLQIHEELKIEWARTLLGVGAWNVAQVARRVGYRDPLYFSRVFSKHVGMSPKRWRAAKKGAA